MIQTKVCVCINWSVGWLVSIQEGVAERHLRQRVGGRGADAAQHVFPAPGAGPAWDLRPGGLPPGPHPGLRGAHGAQRRDPGPGPPHPGLPRHRRLPAGLQRMTFDPRDGPGLGSGLREVDGSEDHRTLVLSASCSDVQTLPNVRVSRRCLYLLGVGYCCRYA